MHSGGACADRRGVVQHQRRPRPIAAPAGPRRSTHRAPHRRCRARARAATRSSCAARTSSPPRRCRTRPRWAPHYDCGEFEKNMEHGAGRSPITPALPRGARTLKRRGKLRGIGIANAIERAAGPGTEFAEIRFDTERHGDLADGHQERTAKGTRRPSARSCTNGSALRPDEMRYIDGDTDRRRLRHGHERLALDRHRRHGADARRREGDRQGASKIAAHLLEVSDADARFRRWPLQRRRHRPRPDA